MTKVDEAYQKELDLRGWIAVDFDGTLAQHDGDLQRCELGEPVPRMVERVKQWLAQGKDVRIFTARVQDDRLDPHEQRELITAWCVKHLGQPLRVTCLKDWLMLELWDDRAVQVMHNTGENLVEVVSKQFQQEIKRLEQVVASLNAEIENNQ